MKLKKAFCTYCKGTLPSSKERENYSGDRKMYIDLCDACYWNQKYINLIDEIECILERYKEIL